MMITRALVAAVLLAASVVAPGLAKSSPPGVALRLDYAWWQKANPQARAATVRATILASMTGWELGVSAARSEAAEALVASDAKSAIVAITRAPIPDGPVYPRRLSYYVAAVGSFYAKHPKARKYEVPDVVYSCLQAKFSKDDCNRMIGGGGRAFE
jgi:hypothetical protein